MSRRWVEANLAEFARDVMRDFCMASVVLEGQFHRFDEAGAVSFPVMRDLLGEMMNKGLLWRLKDTAHHLFRNDPAQDPVAPMLDWAVGYVFHECVKLKEDAYQHQHYAPQYRALREQDMGEEVRAIVEPLASMLAQTRESMEREIRRIRYILGRTRRLMCLYYAAHGGNRLLARLLFDRDELVRSVFGEEYGPLLQGLYGDKPERMFIQAGESLLDGGRPEDALRAARAAVALAPGCQRAHRLAAEAEQRIDQTPRRRAI